MLCDVLAYVLPANFINLILTNYEANYVVNWFPQKLINYLCFPTDIDNNGFLDAADFQCMAVRACIVEGKGDCNPATLKKYQDLMTNLWAEISALADFDNVNFVLIKNF